MSAQVWARVLAVLMVTVFTQGCGTPASSTPSSGADVCKLPIYWSQGLASGKAEQLRVAFVGVPSGAITNSTTLAPARQTSSPVASYQFSAATYTQTGKWVRVARNLLSPDGGRFVYWDADQSGQVMHSLDLASNADRVIYHGATVYYPIGFESDAIYLTQSVSQGAFANLYRLDPNGGEPRLVQGSDRPMYRLAWMLIADGAAWGADKETYGAAYDYTYSVLRLDLTTSRVLTLQFGPPAVLLSPFGVDIKHRLYAIALQRLWRVDSLGNATELPNPGPVTPGIGTGVETGFVSDSQGAWLPGRGGVWLYADGLNPKEFRAGPANGTTYPAGACFST